MNNYQILNVPINATQREIYSSFCKLIDRKKDFEEQLTLIDAFIILSDIKLRKEYDKTLGLNYSENSPQYLYSYFGNGEYYFDINGNIAGSKELTDFLLKRKKSDIRCSDNINSFYPESEIYTKLAKEPLNDIPLEATKYDTTNLSETEKFEIFKKIYRKHKTSFMFSQEFITYVKDDDFNNLEINAASKRASTKLLNYKRGVCTHFAGLIHEELKALGIESYYIRMMLPNWYHNVVLYRIENNWYIADLSNEYLFGDAGYNVSQNTDYSSINLADFIENNVRFANNIYLPNIFGNTIIDSNVITLLEFLKLKYENQINSL